MSLNRADKPAVRRAATPVVQEKHALAHAPERRGAEILRTGGALRDSIGEARAHIVH